MTIKLTKENFKKNIFDYSTNSEWKYEGKLPAIVDFYADWCGPCKMVAPVLEELSRQYEGRVIIYKVDTDKEEELSAIFSIRSIPTFLFIPLTGPPLIQPGALSKSLLERVIEEHLIVKEQQP